MEISRQLYWLFILSIPIACISWTVVNEEVFKEPREFFVNLSKNGKTYFIRKFSFLFTCEYCFSHYVTLGTLYFTRYKLLLDDWRGYLISGFALVWVANIYMSLFGLLRQNIKKEKTEIKVLEKKQENPGNLRKFEDPETIHFRD